MQRFLFFLFYFLVIYDKIHFVEFRYILLQEKIICLTLFFLYMLRERNEFSMNVNKCERCGCFFVANSDTCPNCQAKDKQDICKLKNFLVDSDESVSAETLSYSTGVSLKNVNRLLQDKNFDFDFNSGSDSNFKFSL